MLPRICDCLESGVLRTLPTEDLDALDGFEGFEQDEASGLYLPSAAPRRVSGPAAVALARGLHRFVLESMDADDWTSNH